MNRVYNLHVRYNELNYISICKYPTERRLGDRTIDYLRRSGYVPDLSVTWPSIDRSALPVMSKGPSVSELIPRLDLILGIIPTPTAEKKKYYRSRINYKGSRNRMQTVIQVNSYFFLK